MFRSLKVYAVAIVAFSTISLGAYAVGGRISDHAIHHTNPERGFYNSPSHVRHQARATTRSSTRVSTRLNCRTDCIRRYCNRSKRGKQWFFWRPYWGGVQADFRADFLWHHRLHWRCPRSISLQYHCRNDWRN